MIWKPFKFNLFTPKQKMIFFKWMRIIIDGVVQLSTSPFASMHNLFLIFFNLIIANVITTTNIIIISVFISIDIIITIIIDIIQSFLLTFQHSSSSSNLIPVIPHSVNKYVKR